MMTENVMASHRLDNGLEIEFLDQGNRYFGDYHQVKLTVSCRIALTDDLLTEHLSDEDLKKARQLFGDHVEYRRLIKQMGVAGAEVDAVRQKMVDNFLANAATYMNKVDFASRFVARKLTENRNRNRMYLAGHD